MSFSAVTCLTYTGSTPLGSVMNLYSDVDGYTTPFQTGVLLTDLTGAQCPYYIDNVPDGTTIIRIYDPSTGCSVDFDVRSNDVCQTCDLNFDVLSAETVSKIVAGNLTGSCEENITDYLVYWYETGNTVTPAYITGYGTEFTPYSFTHPLTGSSEIFAQAGTYEPVIQKVILSGLTFTIDGEEGTIPAELNDCFGNVVVNPLTCSNGDGSSDLPQYEHRVNFAGATSGVPPTTLDATFQLDPTTNYIPYRFQGQSVPDRLTISYVGTNYGDPIILEDMEFGSQLPNTIFKNLVLPKSADTSTFVKKVLTLTGITRSVDDYLIIQVTPNSGNTQTNWDFYCGCLETFDQNVCFNNNEPFKIIYSSITTSLNACNTNNIQYLTSGCTLDTSTDFYKYIYDSSTSLSFYSFVNFYGNNNNISNLFVNKPQITAFGGFISNRVCSSANTNTITHNKYVNSFTNEGEINIESDSIEDISTYYNSYLNAINKVGTLCGTMQTFSGTPYDNTQIEYYRYFRFSFPSATGIQNCGADGVTPKEFYIHPSTVVTTGITGSNYYFNMTIPTVTMGFADNPTCSWTAYVKTNIVDVINNSSTGTSNNYTGTTNTGSRYVDSFLSLTYSCTAVTSNSATTSTGLVQYPKYLNETIPFSGGTIIPSLSAYTLSSFYNPNIFEFNSISGNVPNYQRYNYYYIQKLNNPLDYRDFEIYAAQYTGITSGSEILIYGYTGSTSSSTIYDPTYFV
jgi:hypothetical protein